MSQLNPNQLIKHKIVGEDRAATVREQPNQFSDCVSTTTQTECLVPVKYGNFCCPMLTQNRSHCEAEETKGMFKCASHCSMYPQWHAYSFPFQQTPNHVMFNDLNNNPSKENHFQYYPNCYPVLSNNNFAPYMSPPLYPPYMFPPPIPTQMYPYPSKRSSTIDNFMQTNQQGFDTCSRDETIEDSKDCSFLENNEAKCLRRDNFAKVYHECGCCKGENTDKISPVPYTLATDKTRDDNKTTERVFKPKENIIAPEKENLANLSSFENSKGSQKLFLPYKREKLLGTRKDDTILKPDNNLSKKYNYQSSNYKKGKFPLDRNPPEILVSFKTAANVLKAVNHAPFKIDLDGYKATNKEFPFVARGNHRLENKSSDNITVINSKVEKSKVDKYKNVIKNISNECSENGMESTKHRNYKCRLHHKSSDTSIASNTARPMGKENKLIEPNVNTPTEPKDNSPKEPICGEMNTSFQCPNQYNNVEVNTIQAGGKVKSIVDKVSIKDGKNRISEMTSRATKYEISESTIQTLAMLGGLSKDQIESLLSVLEGDSVGCKEIKSLQRNQSSHDLANTEVLEGMYDADCQREVTTMVPLSCGQGPQEAGLYATRKDQQRPENCHNQLCSGSADPVHQIKLAIQYDNPNHAISSQIECHLSDQNQTHFPKDRKTAVLHNKGINGFGASEDVYYIERRLDRLKAIENTQETERKQKTITQQTDFDGHQQEGTRTKEMILTSGDSDEIVMNLANLLKKTMHSHRCESELKGTGCEPCQKKRNSRKSEELQCLFKHHSLLPQPELNGGCGDTYTQISSAHRVRSDEMVRHSNQSPQGSCDSLDTECTHCRRVPLKEGSKSQTKLANDEPSKIEPHCLVHSFESHRLEDHSSAQLSPLENMEVQKTDEKVETLKEKHCKVKHLIGLILGCKSEEDKAGNLSPADNAMKETCKQTYDYIVKNKMSGNRCQTKMNSCEIELWLEEAQKHKDSALPHYEEHMFDNWSDMCSTVNQYQRRPFKLRLEQHSSRIMKIPEEEGEDKEKIFSSFNLNVPPQQDNVMKTPLSRNVHRGYRNREGDQQRRVEQERIYSVPTEDVNSDIPSVVREFYNPL